MTTYHVPCDPSPFRNVQAGKQVEFILDFRAEPGDILVLNENAEAPHTSPTLITFFTPRPFTGRQQRVRVLEVVDAARQNQILSGMFAYKIELVAEKYETKTHDHVRCGRAAFEMILSGSITSTVEVFSDPVNFGDTVIFKEVANEGSSSPLYTGRQLKVQVTSVDPLAKALARPTGEQGFSFTLIKDPRPLLSEAEQRAILADPVAIACLMAYHDLQHTEATSCGEEALPWPPARYTELKNMGKAIVSEDTELWEPSLLRDFGVEPPKAPTAQHDSWFAAGVVKGWLTKFRSQIGGMPMKIPTKSTIQMLVDFAESFALAEPSATTVNELTTEQIAEEAKSRYAVPELSQAFANGALWGALMTMKAATPEAAEHVRVSPEQSKAVDAALGLVELPPIRVDAETASRMYTTARLAGVVVQEVVRQRLDDFYASDKKEFNPLQQLRDFGWSVGVHNDYRQDGKFNTFWLFTHPDGRYAKGEGPTDMEAVTQVWEKVIGSAVPNQTKQEASDPVDTIMKMVDHATHMAEIDNGDAVTNTRGDILTALLRLVAPTLPRPTKTVEGSVLVPKHMTQAMRDVTDSEGWTWEDLLAAAGSISQEDHADIAAAPERVVFKPLESLDKVLLDPTKSATATSTHTYCPPRASVSPIMTGTCEGIHPDPAMVYTRQNPRSAVPEVDPLKPWISVGGLRREEPSNSAHYPDSGDALDHFQEGQWWIQTLDDMVSSSIGEPTPITDDMKRAVAVVHNLLRVLKAKPAAAQDATDPKPVEPNIPGLAADPSAFVRWALSQKYDTTSHPMFFTFLNEKTNAARMGWKAACDFYGVQT